MGFFALDSGSADIVGKKCVRKMTPKGWALADCLYTVYHYKYLKAREDIKRGLGLPNHTPPPQLSGLNT